MLNHIKLCLFSLLLIPFSSYCSILTTVSFPFELHTIFLSNSSILAQNLKILSRHHFHLPLTPLHRATTTTTTTLFSLQTSLAFAHQTLEILSLRRHYHHHYHHIKPPPPPEFPFKLPLICHTFETILQHHRHHIASHKPLPLSLSLHALFVHFLYAL